MEIFLFKYFMETEITADTGERRKSQEEALSLYDDESLRPVMRYAGGEDPLLAFGCSRPAVLVYVKRVPSPDAISAMVSMWTHCVHPRALTECILKRYLRIAFVILRLFDKFE